MSRNPPLILGVAGGTGSGKTAVARAILDAVGRERIAHVPLDSYYRDVDWTEPAEIHRHNFDHPSAFDWELLAFHFDELKGGRAVELPVYDFKAHRRLARTTRCEARPVVLTEGILLLAEPRIRELLDFRIFVETDDDVRLARRIRRDMSERGRTLDDILRQYMETVRPMHLEFVEPSRRWADLIVPEGGHNTHAVATVIARIEQLLAEAGAGAS